MKQPSHNQAPEGADARTNNASPVIEMDLPPALPGFDLDAGLKRLQGNRALYLKLLGKFVNDYSGIGGEIQQAVDAGDMQHTHALVHNLKGLAGNLSATDLFVAARTVDEAARSATVEPESPAFRRAVSALHEALKGALASARSVLPDPQPAPVENTGAIDLNEGQLLDLARLIREAVDLGDVMSIHENAVRAAGTTAVADKITALAEAFDFDGLLSLADELERNAGR